MFLTRSSQAHKIFELKYRFIFGCLLICFCSFTNVNANDKSNSELERELAESKKLLEQLNQHVQKLEEKFNDLASENTAERLDSLEDSVFEIDERVGSRAVVHAFDGMSLDVGGFFHSTYTIVESEDGGASAFDRQNFELLLRAEFNEDWSAFFAGGFLRESDDPFSLGTRENPEFNSRNKTPQIIAWTNYELSDLVNFRLGRFITPHGIINIQHFPATLLDPEQPQFLRPFSGDTIFPNFSTGFQTHGSKYFGSNSQHRYEYNSYISNPNIGGANEEEIYGWRNVVTIGKSGLTLGANLARGGRANNSDYNMFGGDILYDKGKLLWKTELFSTNESSGYDDRFTFYTQPAWRISPNWIAFYRYDYLDNGFTDSTENVLGVNYTPISGIRLRAIAKHSDLESGISESGDFLGSVDAYTFQLSGTFSF